MSRNLSSSHPGNVLCFCPRCGSRSFEHRQGGCLKCSHCEFEFYVNAACAVAALILDTESRLMLTRRKYPPHAGMLDLPGGFVDLLETAEHALQREVMEELNLSITEYRYFCSSPNEYVYGGMSYYTLDLVYFCQVEKFSSLLVGDDITEALFEHPFDVDIDAIGGQSVKNIIARYQQYLQRNGNAL